MKTTRRNPDHLEDQCRAWLARRKEQPINDELIKDFCLYLWKNKKKSDLELMRSFVKSDRPAKSYYQPPQV